MVVIQRHAQDNEHAWSRPVSCMRRMVTMSDTRAWWSVVAGSNRWCVRLSVHRNEDLTAGPLQRQEHAWDTGGLYLTYGVTQVHIPE